MRPVEEAPTTLFWANPTRVGSQIARAQSVRYFFSSKDVTIYAISPSRGHDVPEDILGPDFDGYLIVDGLKSYDVLEVAKGRCNGHLLRRCKNLHDVVLGKERRYLESLSRQVPSPARPPVV